MGEPKPFPELDWYDCTVNHGEHWWEGRLEKIKWNEKLGMFAKHHTYLFWVIIKREYFIQHYNPFGGKIVQ